MKLGDMHFSNNVLSVDLWYPRLETKPGDEPRTPDHPVAVEVGLVDVRAADSIRIEFDFDRNGYVVKQASTFEWEADDEKQDPDWQEVSFVPAWGRERREGAK